MLCIRKRVAIRRRLGDAACTPTAPLAPATFSTMICCPSSSAHQVSDPAREQVRRASRSVWYELDGNDMGRIVLATAGHDAIRPRSLEQAQPAHGNHRPFWKAAPRSNRHSARVTVGTSSPAASLVSESHRPGGFPRIGPPIRWTSRMASRVAIRARCASRFG